MALSSRISLPLLGAALLLPFAIHQTTLAPAAWLAPVLLLRVMRTTRRPVVGWLCVVTAYVVGSAIGMRGRYVPLPPLVAAVVILYAEVVHSLPYVLDRSLGARVERRFGVLARTLVFPAAMTSTELLAMRFAPFGTWGSAAYTQHDQLALIQVVAITGIWGVTFLVHWLAPVVNALWERDWAVRTVAASVATFAGALTVVLLAGGVRLAFSPASGASVTVATLVPSVSRYDSAFAGIRVVPLAAAAAAERARARDQFTALSDDLLSRTEAAALAGAKVISWPESVPTLAEDEAALLRRVAEIAVRHGVTVLATPWVVRKTDRFPYVENLSVLVGEDGASRWRYPKTYPVFGIENTKFGRGPGVVPIAETRSGRLASVICQDMDFPWLVRQAGRGGADVLLAPSDDWFAIREMHAQMAVFRAIENGVPLVRATSNGVSEVTDAYGRTLGRASAFQARSPVLLLTVPLPSRRGPTLYARFGDWFAFLCVGWVLLCVAVVVVAGGSSGNGKGPETGAAASSKALFPNGQKKARKRRETIEHFLARAGNTAAP